MKNIAPATRNAHFYAEDKAYWNLLGTPWKSLGGLLGRLGGLLGALGGPLGDPWAVLGAMLEAFWEILKLS